MNGSYVSESFNYMNEKWKKCENPSSSYRKSFASSFTYGVELEFLSSKINGTRPFVHNGPSGSGTRSGLSACEGTGASSKGKKGSSGLHGQNIFNTVLEY